MKSQVPTDPGGDDSLGTGDHGINHTRGDNHALCPGGIRMYKQQLLEARSRSACVVWATETVAGEGEADKDYRIEHALMIV